MAQKWKNFFFNLALLLNGVLIILLLFGKQLQLPAILQVAGRAHPLMLHFPITLFVIAVLWALFVPSKNNPLLLEIQNNILLATAVTTVLTSLMGLFLSKEEGYDEDAIALHKWSGVIMAQIILLWYAFNNTFFKNKILTSFVGVLGLAGIFITGHQGANITHGENFLLAPVTDTHKKPDVLLEDAVAYTHFIEPILQEKCMNCHNSRKAKGELVMETKELLLKGGKNGKLWDTTASGLGLLMQRLHLPLEDKKHMPPKGKPQLQQEELQAIFYWIKSGADFTKKVIDYPVTDSLRVLASAYFNNAEAQQYNFAAAKQSDIDKLNNDYRVIKPFALQSPALAVEFFGSALFDAEKIKELAPLKNNIVSLNASHMPVTDKEMAEIASFKNLRRLNLGFTKITNEGVKLLANLPELKQLTLSGTSVNLNGLEPLTSLKKLSALYLWRTSLSDNDINTLRKKLPRVLLDEGFNGDTIVARLNAPIILADKEIITGEEAVKLKHYINGVEIRYTLDGTEPDSLSSSIYKEAITIKNPAELKAKAFLKGWISSDVSAKNFYKATYSPDTAWLLTEPAKQYAALGAKSLIDRLKSDINFTSGMWLGYKDNQMVAMVYFKELVNISSVTFSALINNGSYIMPPQKLEVWGGTTEKDLKVLGTVLPKGLNGPDAPSQTRYTCKFQGKTVKYLKLVAKPLPSLPAWHPGKGQKAWVFIDEVFFN